MAPSLMNTACRKSTLKLTTLFCSLLLVFISACEPPPHSQKKPHSNNTLIINDEAEAYLVTNKVWQQGLFILTQLQQQAQSLKKSGDQFLTDPSQDLLLVTIDEWNKTQSLYEQLFTFLSIKHPSLSPLLASWKDRIAPWPLLAGYLDSIGDYTQSGIVNDISLPLTKDSVIHQHQLTDIEEVTLGLYAIEFILLGDGLQNSAVNTAIARFSEQTTIPSTLSGTDLSLIELPNNRRRHLLKIQLDVLIDDINLLSKEWKVNGKLHAQFFQLNSSESLKGIYDSLVSTLDNIEKDLPTLIILNQKAIDLLADNHENRSHKHLLSAMEQRLSVIDSICCKTTLEKNEKKLSENSPTKPPNTYRNFSDILSEKDKRNLLIKVYGIKKRLNKN